MSFIKKILKIGLLVYFGFGLFIFLGHRNMIYHPNLLERDFHNCPAFVDSEKLNMNGTRAYYKHISDKIVIVYNGNAGSACDRAHLRFVFEEAGHSHLFVEYAGFGGDDRTPSRALLFQDVENVVSFLDTANYTEVVIFAESIGSGVASYHSTLMHVSRIILISPFDSLISVAKNKFPMYPMFLLEKFSDENFDNIDLLSSFQGELKILHGTKDNIVPIRHSKNLFENMTTENKTLVKIEGAGHNDMYNFEQTWNSINSFFKPKTIDTN